MLMLEFPDSVSISLIAALIGVLSNFIVGNVWYMTWSTPFQESAQRLHKVSMKEIMKTSNMGLAMGSASLFGAIMCICLNMLFQLTEPTNLCQYMSIAFLAFAGFKLSNFPHYAFVQVPLQMYFIDMGHELLQSQLMAVGLFMARAYMA
eukprot:EC791107.1.p2 GENE.EC791107.1~~EC791107.1.p2  ORF type:complete len:149 (+),score=61.93 EC791107.1:68-514(+)